MYLMAAMAVGSLISSNSQRKAQMAAKVADAKLQRARLEKARMRSTEDYVANSQRAREAAQDREVQIESSRLDAESRMAETFAGSGISGTSVSELDAELNASVEKNKMENIKALDQQLGDLTRNYVQGMGDTADQAASIDTTRVKGSFLGDAFKATSAAASVASLDAKLTSSIGSFSSGGSVPTGSSAYNYAPSRGLAIG